MAKAPEPERVFEVGQLFAELVQVPVRLGVAVDDEPRLLDAFARFVGRRPVAREMARRHRQAASRQQAQRFVVERRRLERFPHLGQQVGPMLVRLEHRRILVAEPELDHPVLPALEAAARGERRPHRRVLGRRHRRQHVPGVDQLLHDLADARQHLEGALQLIAGDRRGGRLELVQQQLHPQLADLVLDDEEHLVVRFRAALLGAEHVVEMQVVAVAHVAAEVELRRVFFTAGGRCDLARVGHHVTAARRLNRGSRQTPLASTSASTCAASKASTKRV